jgi:hypothetical protein
MLGHALSSVLTATQLQRTTDANQNGEADPTTPSSC